jgi:L-seryl-tRNA(Ser) seleniumtransferase
MDRIPTVKHDSEIGSSPAEDEQDRRRGLPSVDRLIRELGQGEGAELPRWALGEGVRKALARARAASEPLGSAEELGREALREARALAAPRPRPVVNATGVVLHTNLGRAVLGPGAAAAVAAAAQGYGDLELDLESGERGDRLGMLEAKLGLLCGAEGVAAVNNGAAAVLLALDTFARGREVVVSRGELVEIGGSFRVPEILERANVRLVEVGTTNRTHLRDYEGAIGPATALLLKVHRSNFEQRGFVAEVALAELVELGRRRGVPVVEDLGSGTLVDLRSRGFPEESFAPARLRSGVDALCFSGDKLLGGPQAGLVLGARERVAAMRRNPLARALRLDKLRLAALDWLASALLAGRFTDIPTLRMLLAPPDELAALARSLSGRLAAHAPEGLAVELAETRAPVGGGSLPGFELASFAVALSARCGATALSAQLRRSEPAVLGRIDGERLLLDVRTLLPGDDDHLVQAVRSLTVD